MIAADLDGTLLGADGRVSAHTMNVLAQIARNGTTVVAATGRGALALPDFEPTGIVEMAVCSNGAIVVDLASEQIVERTELAGSDAAVVMSEIRSSLSGACFAWETQRGFGYEHDFAAHGKVLIESYPNDGDDYDPALAVSKMFVAVPGFGYLELIERVRNIISVDAEVTSAGLPWVVVTAAGVTKAGTLDRLCSRRGIDPADVVAFGDSWNDVDMLRWAGMGVAMGNAPDAIKQVADVVAGSHADHGVANFLIELLNLPSL